MRRHEFAEYDEAVAAGLSRGAHVAGLPGYLGTRVVEVGPRTMACEVDARDELLTPFGTLHGGVVSALTDDVLGFVCYPVIPRGAWAATSEFKLNLVAPVRDGVVRSTAAIVAISRRTAVVHVEVVNADRLVALAQGTVTIQRPEP